MELDNLSLELARVSARLLRLLYRLPGGSYRTYQVPVVFGLGLEILDLLGELQKLVTVLQLAHPLPGFTQGRSLGGFISPQGGQLLSQAGDNVCILLVGLLGRRIVERVQALPGLCCFPRHPNRGAAYVARHLQPLLVGVVAPSMLLDGADGFFIAR